jgi:hypothetical protein
MSKRIWIYLCDKKIVGDLFNSIANECTLFINEWNAHGSKLDSSFKILYEHFLVFEVNEELHQASGCSIDKQLQLVKKLEKDFNISLLNRLLVAYRLNNEIIVQTAGEVKQAVKNNLLSPDTITFDISITDSELFETEFEKPISLSWLMPKTMA